MIDLQMHAFQPMFRGVFSCVGRVPHISNNNYDQLLQYMSPGAAMFVKALHSDEIEVNLQEIYKYRNKDPISALELIRLFLFEDVLDITPPAISHALLNTPPVGPMKELARKCFGGEPVETTLPKIELTGPAMAETLDEWFSEIHAELNAPGEDPRWVIEQAASGTLWKLRSWLWNCHDQRLVNQRVRLADGRYGNARDALLLIAENAPHNPEDTPDTAAPISTELAALLMVNPQLFEVVIRLVDAMGIDMDWYDPKYSYKDIVTYLANGIHKLFNHGYNVNRMLLAAVKSIY